MSDVDVQIVREFFELNMFQAMTYWPPGQVRPYASDHAVLLFVQNTNAALPGDLEFAINPTEIHRVARAMVDVRAWHGDRLYPSVVESNPVLTQFADSQSTALAGDVFGGMDFTTILVVSELPQSQDQRERSISLLQEAGVGHVLEFGAILRNLLSNVSANGSYALSPTLHMLRLLKRYRLVRHQQMEFTFATEPPPAASPPPVEVQHVQEEREDAVEAE